MIPFLYLVSSRFNFYETYLIMKFSTLFCLLSPLRSWMWYLYFNLLFFNLLFFNLLFLNLLFFNLLFFNLLYFILLCFFFFCFYWSILLSSLLTILIPFFMNILSFMLHLFLPHSSLFYFTDSYLYFIFSYSSHYFFYSSLVLFIPPPLFIYRESKLSCVKLIVSSQSSLRYNKRGTRH